MNKSLNDKTNDTTGGTTNHNEHSSENPLRHERHDDLLKISRKIFSGECSFRTAASQPRDFPSGNIPEIALAGRSNVGKSSLINALTNRKALARTSRTPGRTQNLIFFNLADTITLTDFPGHGFAQAPLGVIKQWRGLINAYIKHRAQLRMVCVLLDSRRNITTEDEELMTLLDNCAVPWQIVITKADKANAGELSAAHARAADCIKNHVAAKKQVLETSADKGLGIEELRMEIVRSSLSI